jgi:hypothetical protein
MTLYEKVQIGVFTGQDPDRIFRDPDPEIRTFLGSQAVRIFSGSGFFRIYPDLVRSDSPSKKSGFSWINFYY